LHLVIEDQRDAKEDAEQDCQALAEAVAKGIANMRDDSGYRHGRDQPVTCLERFEVRDGRTLRRVE
jgi:hypothetical protein